MLLTWLTEQWLDIFLIIWHFFIKNLQNKFTQTIFTTRYQIKKIFSTDCIGTKHWPATDGDPSPSRCQLVISSSLIGLMFMCQQLWSLLGPRKGLLRKKKIIYMMMMIIGQRKILKQRQKERKGNGRWKLHKFSTVLLLNVSYDIISFLPSFLPSLFNLFIYHYTYIQLISYLDSLDYRNKRRSQVQRNAI